MAMVFCRGCAKEIHESAPTCPNCGATPAVSRQDAIPDGVRGWSWGAFVLTWIWAIGNRTWIGLLALIPYVNIGVAIWLGIKGREMAWKNASWESVEHFNRVQKKWSQWAVGILVGAFLIGVIAAVAGSGYQEPSQRARQSQL